MTTASRYSQLTADTPPNTPPTVDAGPARTIHEGGTFTMSGATAADGDDGTVLEYSWSAPDGSGVTFADPTVLLPTVTAPVVTSDTSVTLTLTVDDQSGTWTATATDTVVLTVMETSNHFVTTWKTIGANEEITIPGAGTYDVVWGDGAATDETDTAEHEYADAGTYTVAVTGGFERIHLDPLSSNTQKLESIEQWGDIGWASMGGAFYGARSLIYNANDAPDLSGVANMSSMFRATTFDGNFSGWNVSQVTDMSYMFHSARSFNGDVSDWDVSKVTDMNGMFENAAAFNQDISTWNVSAVTRMNSMFAYATSFNQDLSGWDVSQVADMSYMFKEIAGFNGDVSDWDVSNVTDMTQMFYLAKAFNGDVSDWNVSSVTDMTQMFNLATAFNGNVSRWNVSSVTDMSQMFATATDFNQPLSDWDVSSVTDMYRMFFDAADFNQDISDWDVSGVTDMSEMFENAFSFRQNLGNWYVVPADTAYATLGGHPQRHHDIGAEWYP